jgi:uncharacterized membrane protein HdeD (DUF308 family)
MEFRVLLGAVTLFLLGFLLFAFAAGYVSLINILGIVLAVDGVMFAGHGFTFQGDASSKRFRMVWGSILALAGVTILVGPNINGNVLVPVVVGVAMVLIGVFVLYGEAYGGR